MNTVDATERYLDRLPSDIAESPMAATALTLAAGLDDPHNSLTSRSMAAKAFQDIMREIRDLAPADEVKDELDDLVEGRRLRLVGGAAAQD